MLSALAACNCVVFLLLAALHAYWALGGTVGLAASLPARADGTAVYRPPRLAVWAVAGVLLALAALAASHVRPVDLPAPSNWRRGADAGLALCFLLRAAGDLRYVGFSKQVRHTTFAERDTRYYSPLCLLLAGTWAALALAS